MVSVQLRLRPEEAALVMNAIESLAEDGNLADGAIAMAERALRGTADSTRAPVELVVHIDASSLEGRLEDGTGISAETCQRLCCDAGIVPML